MKSGSYCWFFYNCRADWWDWSYCWFTGKCYCVGRWILLREGLRDWSCKCLASIFRFNKFLSKVLSTMLCQWTFLNLSEYFIKHFLSSTIFQWLICFEHLLNIFVWTFDNGTALYYMALTCIRNAQYMFQFFLAVCFVFTPVCQCDGLVNSCSQGMPDFLFFIWNGKKTSLYCIVRITRFYLIA